MFELIAVFVLAVVAVAGIAILASCAEVLFKIALLPLFLGLAVLKVVIGALVLGVLLTVGLPLLVIGLVLAIPLLLVGALLALGGGLLAAFA